MPRSSIFICHSSKDKSFVEKLARDLIDVGIDVWYDKWEIKVGDSIIDKIETGILKSSYMGIVLSPNSIKSNWVKKELNAGLMKEIKKNKVVVLPIRYKQCILPPLLSDKKYADFTSSYNDGLEDLLEVFNINTIDFQKGDVPKGHLFMDNMINNLYTDNFFRGE
jgi:hypothetical protein